MCFEYLLRSMRHPGISDDIPATLADSLEYLELMLCDDRNRRKSPVVPADQSAILRIAPILRAAWTQWNAFDISLCSGCAEAVASSFARGSYHRAASRFRRPAIRNCLPRCNGRATVLTNALWRELHLAHPNVEPGRAPGDEPHASLNHTLRRERPETNG